MNYGELKDRIAGSVANSYSHRDDIDESVLEDLIDQARERIGTLLRNRQVQTRTTISVTDGAGPLPAGLEKIVSVLDSQGLPLRSMNSEEYALFEAGTGSPVGYYVSPTQLLVAPTETADYTIDYYADPLAFTDDADPVIEPALFIYGTMVELANFTDDAGRLQSYEAQFLTRMQEVNDAHRFEQRAIGKSQYDYSVRTIGV